MADAASTTTHDHADPPDLAGTVLSVLCVVHCAATPFLVTALPAMASVLGGFHPVALVFVLGVALWAFVPGYRQHQKVEVLVWAGAGLVLLGAAALFLHEQPVLDTGLSVLGAGSMLTAHWRNRKLKHAACCH